jgi:hypothetical protein
VSDSHFYYPIFIWLIWITELSIILILILIFGFGFQVCFDFEICCTHYMYFMWGCLEVVEAVRGQKSWSLLWHFNSTFGSSQSASSANQRFTKKWDQIWLSLHSASIPQILEPSPQSLISYEFNEFYQFTYWYARSLVHCSTGKWKVISLLTSLWWRLSS